MSHEDGQAGVTMQRLVIKDSRPTTEIVSINNAAITINDLEVQGTVKGGNTQPVLPTELHRNYQRDQRGATIATLNLDDPPRDPRQLPSHQPDAS